MKSRKERDDSKISHDLNDFLRILLSNFQGRALIFWNTVEQEQPHEKNSRDVRKIRVRLILFCTRQTSFCSSSSSLPFHFNAMRPPPPVIIPQPHTSFTSNSLPSTSSNSNLNLSLTIRHLPTDTWRAFTVPTEFRISDIKRLALETFEEDRSSSDSKSLSKRRGKASSSRDDSQEEKENLARSSKGKETKLSGDSLLAVAGSEKEKKSGGVRRFTNALRDRVSYLASS